MDEIELLQNRLMTAMERIGSGTERVVAKAAEISREEATLRQALEEEKLANAQLEERLQSLNARHAEELELAQASSDGGDIEALQQQIASQSDALANLDASLQKLKAANDALRASNAALRAANEEGVGDASLINESLKADLNAATAAHQAETAEIGAILSRIEPMLAQTRHQEGVSDG